MEPNPLVSVIIPVFNGERYLAEAIDSVLAQTYQPWELILVDDGSSDGTAKIAKSYPMIHYIYQSNLGNGAAKNAGIAAAKGHFLAFLDADDVWTADKLEKQMGYLLDHSEVEYVIARMKTTLDPGTEWPSSLIKENYEGQPVGYLPSTLVARRAAFEQIGVFDPGLRRGNDGDWFFRAKDAGLRMAVLPQVLLHRRIHESNVSHDTQDMTSDLLRAVRASIERKQARSNGKESG